MSEPKDHTEWRVRRIALQIGANEGAAFSVDFGADDTPFNLITYLRGDQADNEKRQAALIRYRELALPCVEKNKNGVFDLGTRKSGSMFCLVALGGWQGGNVRMVLTFIVNCLDTERATTLLQHARALTIGGDPEGGMAGSAVPNPPSPKPPTLKIRLDEPGVKGR